MRWTLIPLLLACRVAPPDCSAGACEPICEQTERASLALHRAPISDLAAQILADDIADLRAGVRPVQPDSIGLCAGSTSCARPLPQEDAILPASGGVLRAIVQLPRRMPESQIKAFAYCPPPSRSLEWRAEVIARPSAPGEPVRIDPLLKIPPLDEALRCNWQVTIEHPSHSQTITGTFRSERLSVAPAAER